MYQYLLLCIKQNVVYSYCSLWLFVNYCLHCDIIFVCCKSLFFICYFFLFHFQDNLLTQVVI